MVETKTIKTKKVKVKKVSIPRVKKTKIVKPKVIKPQFKVAYKTLNNKSRKGLYAYVKERGKRASYYKVKPEVGQNDKAYLSVYKTGGIKSSKGITKKVLRERKSGKQKLKQYPNIDASLQSGYAQATVENAKNLNVYGIKMAYRDLLLNKDKAGERRGILKDPLLLNILTMPENVIKWQHRVMYKVNLYDQNNDVLATVTPETVKNLSDIQREIIGKIVLGQEFSTMYKELGEAAKLQGYRLNAEKNKKGRITNVKIKLTFKKA